MTSPSPADELLAQARALGDPNRLRLFRYLVAHDEPAAVAELTDMAGLNHNTVRQHLAVLVDAGLVDESREVRSRVGRPRLLYRADAGAASRWDAPGTYVWLAELLSDALSRQISPREAGRLRGVQRAAELSDGGSALDVMEADLARRGFHPRRESNRTRVDFVLERCPFVDVAAVNPATVCQLHLGLVEGLATGLGGWEVEDLVAHSPREAGCRLALRAVAARRR